MEELVEPRTQPFLVLVDSDVLFPCLWLLAVRVRDDLMKVKDDKSHLAVLFTYFISVLCSGLF